MQGELSFKDSGLWGGTGNGPTPLVDPADHGQRLIHPWNDTATPFPADRTIDAIFREHALLNPTAIAVEDGGKRITYGELDRQADSIAATLARHSVKAGDAVAIALPRSALLIAGILGILKTGASYVPLDLAYPISRLERMLHESGAKILLGEGEPLPLETAVTFIAIDSVSRQEAGLTPGPHAADSVAYIMFTSGSTGVPKGVRVLHRGISRLVTNTNYIDFGPHDVVAHASNTSFDASTFEIWGALLNGARLVIVPGETLFSPHGLADFIRDRGISVLFLTTPLFHQYAHDVPEAFGTLRYLVVGGSVLQPEPVRAVLQAGKPMHLINGYGPTEATTFAICHEVGEVAAGALSIPIGRPISNTRAYILDRSLKPVQAGGEGELYLGGAGVAAGYVNAPALTDAVFISDPFSDDPSSRLYKTGDLARWREDGVIEFLGRVDNQVKIRGFRIEPGEIEAALLRHPRIRQAVVIPRMDSAGEHQLAAFIAPSPGPDLTSTAMRAHLLESLPEYMLPATVNFLEKLPLNANGKVDVAALGTLPLAEAGHAHAIPGTWMEASLVEIWEDVLDHRPIGVTDDFFELGGHSLLAIRMLAEVEKRTGIAILPRLLFENATIRRLAIAARRPETMPHSAIFPVQTGGSVPPLFFLHGDFVEGGLYCVKMARYIGPDRPFYAIDPHGVHDDPPHSIEEMASARLELIRQVRPRGPYVLGGFCNGGLVAFEMARQLEAAGETVSSLVLVSADGSNSQFSWLDRLIQIAPGHGEQKFHSFLHWRERILFAHAVLLGQLEAIARPVPLSQQPGRFARKSRRIMRKLVRLMLPRRAADAPASINSTSAEAAGMDIAQIYNQACAAYVPRPYRGPAHLLWPSESSLQDPCAGWASVMPRLKVVPVPGGHFSSLQGENLRVVSEKIQESLLQDHA